MSVPFAELPELRGLRDYVAWPLQWGWHTSVPILHKKSGMGVIVQLVHQERLGPFQLVDPFGEELRREEAHPRRRKRVQGAYLGICQWFTLQRTPLQAVATMASNAIARPSPLWRPTPLV